MVKNLTHFRAHSRVETIDDERSIGNGLIVTLRQGWTFDALDDNRVAGADDLKELNSLIESAKPFVGPFTL